MTLEEKIAEKYTLTYFNGIGGKGLTSTSAEFLCAIGQDLISNIKQSLENISLVNTTVQVAGTDKPMVVRAESGVNLLKTPNALEDNLNKIANINAFTAWMRSAIKEKEAIFEYIDNYSFNDWAEDYLEGEEKHIAKVENVYGDFVHQLDKNRIKKKVFNEQNVKELAAYLITEAKAATYGKYIKKDGPLSNIKSEVVACLSKPYSVEGTGTNTTVYHTWSNVDYKDIEAEYLVLQGIYREDEACLNKMKYNLEKKEEKYYKEANSAYAARAAEVREIVRELSTRYNSFIQMQREQYSTLKILVPDDLLETFNELEKITKAAKAKK